jgi:uncharacterized membrane protein YfcA
VGQLAILGVGLVAGGLYGAFGAGGAAFATPVLALAGVPGVLAIASPLPAMLPASLVSAHAHLRAGTLDRRVATLAVAGGLPGALLGALASSFVDGPLLLVLSAVLLLGVGVRILLPDPASHLGRCEDRLERPHLVVALAFAVGLLTGLLANGGGFLLVPMFVLVLGLTTAMAAGTSMVVAGFLSLPTLAVHWSLGHIDWRVAALFTMGVLPGLIGGRRLAARVPTEIARRSFGVLLVAFAAWFLIR